MYTYMVYAAITLKNGEGDNPDPLGVREWNIRPRRVSPGETVLSIIFYDVHCFGL